MKNFLFGINLGDTKVIEPKKRESKFCFECGDVDDGKLCSYCGGTIV